MLNSADLSYKGCYMQSILCIAKHFATKHHRCCLWLMQAEAGEQSCVGSSIIAGDDADLPTVSYSTDMQEPLDCCIDITVGASPLICLPLLHVPSLATTAVFRKRLPHRLYPIGDCKASR